MSAGRPTTAGTLALVALIALAGCLQVPDEGALDPAVTGAGLRVADPDGNPVPHAAVTALDATGAPLAALGADGNGTLAAGLVPAAAATLAVGAPGFAPATVAAVPLPALVTLERLANATLSPTDATPILQFLPPVDLGADYLNPVTKCTGSNCGLSEPVIEVAGDGSIYVSGTCCIGRTPPVWVSRDGGATFTKLQSPTRDLTGIEGDFAIDDVGNVYFTDILVGAMWFTSWDKDGKERWTLPVPFKPLVDRPWVRAGAENVVYFLYNTGFSTEFHRSTDGGRTWSLSLKSFPFALGSLGQGPTNEHLVVVGGNPDKYYESLDGGLTWSAGETIPVPGNGSMRHNAYVVLDEAANAYVVYPYGDDETGVHVFVSRRAPDGTWSGPHQVSPAELGANEMPWPAALRNGTLVLAWYGSPGDPAVDGNLKPGREWYLYAAASLNAASDSPTFQVTRADPDPVITGNLGRRLLDFLQIDVGPDGAAYIAYSASRDGSPDEHTLFVRSTIGLQLQPAAFPYGPVAAPSA